MKKLVYSATLVLSLGLAACNDIETKDEKNLGNINSVEVEEKKIGVAKSADEVIEYFKAEGLEIGDISELKYNEFGALRDDGKRIKVPSLGEGAGGRLIKFKEKEVINEAKTYYNELNNDPLFYSHVHTNGLFLLQMNGDMEDVDFEKYKNAMDAALD